MKGCPAGDTPGGGQRSFAGTVCALGAGNHMHHMNTIAILPVLDEQSVELVASLAASIWREHYPSIIGAAQVEYMLEKFQSSRAIVEQVRAGYRYYLMKDMTGAVVGYFSVIARERELFLSKIYLERGSRGKGYAREAMRFIEHLAASQSLSAITLTVNKNNRDSIGAYRKMDFVIDGSIVQDIGNGFVMDDYAMRKTVA